MSTGQTFMVIAAMMLLGTLSLGINRTLINSSTTGLEMEAGLDALSYGQSLIDEIMDKEFDEKTTNGQRAFDYTQITAVAAFGPDAGESFTLPDTVDTNRSPLSKTKYDDVDDYHNYSRIEKNSRLDNFALSVVVEYMVEDSVVIGTLAGSPTFYKRVTVTISNPYMIKDGSGNVFPLVLRGLSVYRRYF